MPSTRTNPLLETWTTPFGVPPFPAILPEDFPPAFVAAMAAHRAEIDAIGAETAPPTFDNTVVALDRGGRLLSRIERLFVNLVASESSPALQEVEREVMPMIAIHRSGVLLDAALFARLDELHRRRAGLGLGAEQRQLLERWHLDFVRAGAALEPAARERLLAIEGRLAELATRFTQNVLADEADYRLVLRDERDLAGLPDDVRAAARAAAQERGIAAGWVITLSRSLVVPFLTFSDRRDLRKEAFLAWTRRGGTGNAHDNHALMAETLSLRLELARLHGYDTYADYALVDRMARTPAAANDLLLKAWLPARAKALRERDELAAFARAHGVAEPIEPWDWRYWAEKVRAANYGFDEALLKPYLSLDRMLAAAFDTAQRLFGIVFAERTDLSTYHPDVRSFEVRDRSGSTIGLFLFDNFARQTKHGGAWMDAYRQQSRVDGDVLPIIVNNNNLAKAPAGEPTLLSADDLRTLFHEFGHGLHGLLSNVTYERLSGTQVLADFVEMPSQIFEHWAFEPEVLRRHALHCQTGEPIPQQMLDRLLAARRFNQGFETVEYVACALVDLALHARTDYSGIDFDAFERDERERIGMPREIVLRHRLPHFGHLFSGSWYAAGYYVYLWAQVLDTDGYDAFREAGSPFDPAVAERLLHYVYSAGGTLDPAEAFRRFRGRDPIVEPMLIERGLIEAAPAG